MAKFLYEENDIPEKIKFFVNRRLKIRLKLLEDKDDKSFICNKNETKSNKKNNIYETEEKIQIAYNGNKTAYAKYSLDNIDK